MQNMHRVNWLYFLGTEDNKDEIFIYGLSLPTKYDNKMNSNPYKLGVIGDKNIYLFYSIIDSLELSSIFNETSCKLQLQNIYKKNNQINNSPNVIYKNIFVQNNSNMIHCDRPESPIQSIITANVFYTNQFYEHDNSRYLDSNHIDELSKICTFLSKDTNQTFCGSNPQYAKRLGCFEWAYTQDFSETKIPFNIQFEKHNGNFYKFYFKRENYIHDIIVHLIVYSELNDVILDEIITLKNECVQKYFNNLVQDYSCLTYWVFNFDGKLIHHESISFMKDIFINTNLLTNILSINDKISMQDDRTKEVITYIPNHIKINNSSNNHNSNIVKEKSKIIFDSIREYEQKDFKHGRYFINKNADSILEIFNYINILTNMNECKITIIDPYMNKDSLGPLLRLTNSSMKIEIISCGNQDRIISAIKILNDNKNTIVGRSTWYHLGENEIFHDRYIIIENSFNSSIEVLLLSNSLNNILKGGPRGIGYDFCVVPLSGSTKSNCLLFIDELKNKCTQDNKIWP